MIKVAKIIVLLSLIFMGCKKENQKNSPSNEEERKVELPALDFFKINFISFLVPLYICLGLFLSFEYFFINLFSIPPIIHLIALPVVLLILYYIYHQSAQDHN